MHWHGYPVSLGLAYYQEFALFFRASSLFSAFRTPSCREAPQTLHDTPVHTVHEVTLKQDGSPGYTEAVNQDGSPVHINTTATQEDQPVDSGSPVHKAESVQTVDNTEKIPLTSAAELQGQSVHVAQ